MPTKQQQLAQFLSKSQHKQQVVYDTLSAEDTLKVWKENGLKMTPKLWQENKKAILNYIAKENPKPSTLRGEISSAQNIRKRVELMEVEQRMKTKNKQIET